MANLKELSRRIDDAGLKTGYIVQKLELPSYEALKRRLKGETEFRLDEVKMLANILHLTDAEVRSIFFA